MRKTMVATALSFLMAIGAGAALADTGGHAPSAPAYSRAPGQQGTAANAPAAVGFAEEEVQTAPWTVQRVDKQNHNLVLQAPDGTQNTVSIPAGTPGFDTLKKGDQIQLDYFDAAIVEPAGSPTSSSGSGQKAASNDTGRKVRNIRKVGHNDNMGRSNTNNAKHDTH